MRVRQLRIKGDGSSPGAILEGESYYNMYPKVHWVLKLDLEAGLQWRGSGFPGD